jgi:dTDP-4-dehydrorhamnose 3,5-epimerase
MKTYSDWSFEDTHLDGVKKIVPTEFKDHRGSYIEIYNKDFMNEKGINPDFIQDDISTSHKNVLRGIHGDCKTYKLVSCLHGEFQLIVVNNNPESKQFKKWQSFDISSKNRVQILIPPRFGNGHLVLSEFAIFHYKQNSQYDRSSQFTIKWNDNQYGFIWKSNNPILSERDK